MPLTSVKAATAFQKTLFSLVMLIVLLQSFLVLQVAAAPMERTHFADADEVGKPKVTGFDNAKNE
jgi:hypothetical protein